MTEQELRELVALGAELPGVELKRGGRRTDKPYLAKVVRAVLAMANRRGGGRVLLGVESDGTITGVAEQDLATWSHDDMNAAFAEFADPFVEVRSEVVAAAEGQVLVLHVEEFEITPVLCKRDDAKDLRRGACYVRPRGKPQSVEIPTHAEMRELLDLATEKGVRQFLLRSQRAGLTVATEDVEQAYSARREAFHQEDLPQKITARGYWRFAIVPHRLAGDVRVRDLPAMVDRWSVSRGGEQFPRSVEGEDPLYGSDWTGFDRDTGPYKQSWRIHTDGIFIGLLSFPHDWSAELGVFATDDDEVPPATLWISRAIRDVGRFFLFASNYAHSDFAAAGVTISVVATPLCGRELVMDDPGRVLFRRRTTTTPALDWRKDIAQDDLTTRGKEFALDVLAELFAFFDFRPDEAVLEGIYQKNLGG